MITLLKAAVAAAILVTLAIGASAALDEPSRTVTTTTLIEAPREDVWRVVVDFDAYAEWNPYMRIAGGAAARGGAIDVLLEPDGDAHELDATIYVFNPPRKLRWQSRLLAPGLMDVEYEVIVAPVSARVTELTQRAREEGLLVPVSSSVPTREGLESMAAALARRVEDAT